MNIAIIGSGVSGLAAASLLHQRHAITVYEAAANLGGHVNTVDVPSSVGTVAVDTGFIVHNRRNYPGFTAMLGSLGVETRPSNMGFSVSCRQTGLEYAGQSINSLFAQRRNLVNPRFYAMLSQILRFNREAAVDLADADWSLTLEQYLRQAGYGGWFTSHYLMPMAAAIWSSPPDTIARFPARLFVQFFANHGLLTVNDQPQWRTVVGGSREYVKKLVAPFEHRIRMDSPVARVRRMGQVVELESSEGREQFDHVVLACHSDHALALLGDPSAAETSVLGALPYEQNLATLHTDIGLLPRSPRAWAAWNYTVSEHLEGSTQVTYNMNILQGLNTAETFCVTLNAEQAVAPHHRLRTFTYQHPVYTADSHLARLRHGEINGVNRTWYCGAYWGYGFHEDGFQSGVKVAADLNTAVAIAA